MSLKRYLSANAEETRLRQVVSLLICNIGSSAVRCDLAEFESFTTDIERMRNRLAPDLAPDNLMVIAEAATQALTTYNKRIGSLLESRRSEVQHILGMLQDTVINIAGENTRSGKRLQEITLELEHSGPITDLRVLKGRLTECLTGLREEMVQQKAQAATTMENLQMTIERGGNSVAANSGNGAATNGGNPVAANSGSLLDSVTGLHCVSDGIVAMQTAIDGGKRQYAVVMVVNRVQMIRSRFGPKVGDHMMVGFKEYVAKQLSPSDQLFRWTGPTLVALLERPEPIGNVRLLLKRWLDAKIEVSYSGDGRSVLIPISAGWITLPLTSAADADKQIQTFIASQSTRDSA
jgi:GGDEF domain-containing protein